jgi:hypothetical protein
MALVVTGRMNKQIAAEIGVAEITAAFDSGLWTERSPLNSIIGASNGRRGNRADYELRHRDRPAGTGSQPCI